VLHRLGDKARATVIDTALNYRRPMVVAVHLSLFVSAHLLSFGLRFDFDVPSPQLRVLAVTLPILLAIRAATFWVFHLYEGLWRYVSVRDVVEILKAVTLSSAIFALGVMTVRLQGYPRSILILDWILCVGMTAGLRIVSRLLLERRPAAGATAVPRKRAIIVGAGDVAEALVREIHRGSLAYTVAGLVTDEPLLRGRRLHGVGVIGAVDDLPALCAAYEVSEVLLATMNGEAGDKRRIAERCREAGVVLRAVPAVTEMLLGRAGIAQLREVNDEELLGRSAIGTNVERLREELTGRRVLVTGAAGSIGSELARQIASFGPETLVLFDRAESDLYLTLVELHERFGDVKIDAVIGDILDVDRVTQVMADYSPHLVYHAAAYKHVPMMEAHPIEAIKNNVFGTDIVARAAIAAGVNEFVLISTDKAVKPVGIMGMTKRAAELVVRSLAGHGTTFVAVRFGNVLGSNGSVLPLFQKQIASGSAVTVTDPEAMRYFMLTSEAVELVLTAGALGNDGEVYVLQTGEPIRIGDLADNFIRLSGFEPRSEVPIEVTGLRPGERLKEELWENDRDVVDGPHEKIKVVREPGFDVVGSLTSLEMLQAFVDASKAEASVHFLRSLVRAELDEAHSDLGV
jgi:FlaA1/EpsC-like NDP-sugar epimerase